MFVAPLPNYHVLLTHYRDSFIIETEWPVLHTWWSLGQDWDRTVVVMKNAIIHHRQNKKQAPSSDLLLAKEGVSGWVAHPTAALKEVAIYSASIFIYDDEGESRFFYSLWCACFWLLESYIYLYSIYWFEMSKYYSTFDHFYLFMVVKIGVNWYQKCKVHSYICNGTKHTVS